MYRFTNFSNFPTFLACLAISFTFHHSFVLNMRRNLWHNYPFAKNARCKFRRKGRFAPNMLMKGCIFPARHPSNGFVTFKSLSNSLWTIYENCSSFSVKIKKPHPLFFTNVHKTCWTSSRIKQNKFISRSGFHHSCI